MGIKFDFSAVKKVKKGDLGMGDYTREMEIYFAVMEDYLKGIDAFSRNARRQDSDGHPWSRQGGVLVRP